MKDVSIGEVVVNVTAEEMLEKDESGKTLRISVARLEKMGKEKKETVEERLERVRL